MDLPDSLDESMADQYAVSQPARAHLADRPWLRSHCSGRENDRAAWVDGVDMKATLNQGLDNGAPGNLDGDGDLL